MNVMTSSLFRMQQAEHMMRGRLAEATVSLLLFLQYVEPKVCVHLSFAARVRVLESQSNRQGD